MKLHELPDLSDWRYVEVWTLEEAAMLWAGIDPIEHDGSRLQDLSFFVSKQQHRKALIFLRAAVEAVSAGTLSFVEAWELHEDLNNYWETKIKFPELPDPNKLIPNKTRVQQAAFMKWAESKNIYSYRQQILREELRMLKQFRSPITEVGESNVNTKAKTLELPAPDFLNPSNPTSPRELRASVEVWQTITSQNMHDKGKSIKSVAKEVLNESYKDLSESAKDRIATVVNWKPEGGAPKTPS